MFHPTKPSISHFLRVAICFCFVAAGISASAIGQDEQLQRHASTLKDFIQNNCLDCHSGEGSEGDLDLESLSLDAKQFNDASLNTQRFETIWRRLNAGQMPPAEGVRPSEEEYQSAIASISALLDSHANRFPNAGSPDSIKRLNRTEYRNAIRDLVGIEIDVETFLPKDESSHGFDNVTVGELSPLLLNRYLRAAEKISRLAVGSSVESPEGVTIRLPAERSQEHHVAGLPLGTRGGTSFKHHFPKTGDYEITIKLARDRDEMVEGLKHKHLLDVLVDRGRVHQFTVRPPKQWNDHTLADAHLTTRFHVEAGSRDVGVTFVQPFGSLMETKRQPFDARFNRHRHPRRTPAIFQITIVGPFNPETNKSQPDTKPRKLVFSSYPESPEQESETAKSILMNLMRKAYRRPVSEQDLESPFAFYEQAHEENGFEAGIELALTSILINPNFLFRIEETSEQAGDKLQKISDLELASRLAFFLWSSLPDEELLKVAEAGGLQDEVQLRQQVKRMLADEKASSLVSNFAAQWLYLRNLDSVTPDLRLYPDFDDNLRLAFRGETEHLFDSVIKEDRSVLDLIKSDHTYLNQRLATHYGISGIKGSNFRKVSLPKDSQRGGLLRHGSILTITSYATRTSPTIRGAWILENIFGTPPPPPPENVPALVEKTTLKASTVRERLAMHRADPTCASCHELIDPVGFALENYDALGRWRKFDETVPIDSRGTLYDGSNIDGVNDIEQAILNRPEMFVGTLAEKLIIFALGRGIEHYDGPSIRRIVSTAKQEDFRFSAIVEGIVLSKPFRYRSVQSEERIQP